MLATKQPTFVDSIRTAVDFRRPLMDTHQKLFSNYADAVGRFNDIGQGLKRICKEHLSLDITIPVIPVAGAETASQPYGSALSELEDRLDKGVTALHEALNKPHIGRIEWLDDETCKFTYFDVRRSNCILWDFVNRRPLTHHLVKARVHKLPANDVEKPKEAKDIISKMPKALAEQVRIVTGMQIVKATGQRSDSVEDGALIRFLKGPPSEARPAAVQTPVLDKPLRTQSVSQSAVVDPAIVIGEVCLFGWE